MKDKMAVPPELQDDSLLEWERLVSELDSLGLLNTSDRALMILCCQTWEMNKKAFEHVQKHGPTYQYSNGDIADSAQYKIWIQTTKQLATMLKQLGLTPAARGLKVAETEVGALKY